MFCLWLWKNAGLNQVDLGDTNITLSLVFFFFLENVFGIDLIVWTTVCECNLGALSVLHLTSRGH